MKRVLKRIVLGILVLLVLVQIPFIYRRYQTGKLAQKIAELNSRRTADGSGYDLTGDYKEFKGVIHAHSSLGGHSTGSFEELIAAADANGLDFVLMTEHVTSGTRFIAGTEIRTTGFDSAALTLNGHFANTLFVGGNELDTSDGDRFLLIPGGGEAVQARTQGTTAFLEAAKRENKLAFVTYPERLKSWDAPFDGIEVFNLHTASKQMNPLTVLGDLVWTYSSYPELMLAKAWSRPDENLRRFDEISAERNISLFAGTDAHSNIGFHLFGDDSGNKLINIKLDPYETIFRMARMHVLIQRDRELTRETLVEAIRAGHYFVGFDALGDTSGFQMAVPPPNGSGSLDGAVTPLGGTVPYQEGLMLVARTGNPAAVARFVLYCNGEAVFDSKEEYSYDLRYAIRKPGTYRLEAYRDDLGPPFDKMPWIISNPIYVK